MGGYPRTVRAIAVLRNATIRKLPGCIELKEGETICVGILSEEYKCDKMLFVVWKQFWECLGLKLKQMMRVGIWIEDELCGQRG